MDDLRGMPVVASGGQARSVHRLARGRELEVTVEPMTIVAGPADAFGRPLDKDSMNPVDPGDEPRILISASPKSSRRRRPESSPAT